MITGTLSLDFEVEVENEDALVKLSASACAAVNALKGASNCEEVDSNVEEVEEESED